METRIKMLPIGQLENHPDNPRKDVGDVTELAASIKHSGIMQNLTVVPHRDGYRVVIGHRRLAAAKAAGLTKLPCVISDMNYKEQCSVMLAENMQRRDLTVAEQAQGVQLLLNLGESVDDIAQKTGFSVSTVKKRAKIASLPVEELRQAEIRGATLEEYVKITQIEDEGERKICLNAAGTRDSAWTIGAALKRQNQKKYLPLMRAEAKKIASKMKKPNDRWSSEFLRMGEISVNDFEADEKAFERFDKASPLFWWEEQSGAITIYKKVKKQKAATKKKSSKEIEADEAWKRICELTEQAYTLRKAFLDGLTVTRGNESLIEEYIFQLAAYKEGCYGMIEQKALQDALKKFRANGNYYPTFDEVKMWFKKDRRAKIELLEAFLNDERTEGFYQRDYGGEMPKFYKNDNLDIIYEVLTALGYQISEAEEKLRAAKWREVEGI